MLYFGIVILAVTIISLVGWLCLPLGLIETLFYTVCATVAVVGIDALVASLSRLIPQKWLPSDAKIFQVGRTEKRFYEKIKIRKWKEKVPELGHLTGFRKNRLGDSKSLAYLERFLLENRYGEIVHTASVFFGFLLLLPFSFLPVYWRAFAFPVAIVNGLLNLPSFFILRYNSYKLSILYEKLAKIE